MYKISFMFVRDLNPRPEKEITLERRLKKASAEDGLVYALPLSYHSIWRNRQDLNLRNI